MINYLILKIKLINKKKIKNKIKIEDSEEEYLKILKEIENDDKIKFEINTIDENVQIDNIESINELNENKCFLKIIIHMLLHHLYLYIFLL